MFRPQAPVSSCTVIEGTTGTLFLLSFPLSFMGHRKRAHFFKTCGFIHCIWLVLQETQDPGSCAPHCAGTVQQGASCPRSLTLFFSYLIWNRSYIYLLTESRVVFGKMSALCLSFSCTAWPPVVLMVAGLFYGFSVPVRATAGACEEPTSGICPGLCHLSSLFVSCGIFVSCYCYCGWCLVFLRQGSG